MEVSYEIDTYYFVYGHGIANNRKIIFCVQEDHSIRADFYGRVNGSDWESIGSVYESNIDMEPIGLDEKVDMMVAAKENGEDYEFPQEISFTTLNLEDKTSLIRSLGSTGAWRLSIQRDINLSNVKCELIKWILFFKRIKGV